MTSKRATVDAHLRIAGYHGDDRAWVRLYLEHRVGYERARRLRAEGARLRAAGLPCGCAECRDVTPNTAPPRGES